MLNTIYQFKSGLRLVHRKMDGVRSVSIGVFTGVGSANESPENNGISHFIEHMLFKGTKKRTAFDIVCEIDGLGAQINAFTSKQMTCYYTVSVDEFAPQCMEVLSDLYFNSTFDEGEMEKEKDVVLEEIDMSEDDPSDLCVEKCISSFYDGSSLGYTILGEKANIKSFTQTDLKKYIEENYCSDNTVICVVGNMELKDAKKLTTEYFEGHFTRNKSNIAADVEHLSKSVSSVTFKEIEQSNICATFPSYSFGSEKEMSVMLMNTIFGGGMSSRLFQDIREKQGLAYSVYSYPSTYTNNGSLSIYLGTNIKSGKKALESVRKEILNLKDKGLTQEEFERGQKQIKGAYTLGQESSPSLMRIYARYALFLNKTFDFDERIKSIDNLNMADINQVISRIFDFDSVTTAYVGRKIEYDPLTVIKR